MDTLHAIAYEFQSTPPRGRRLGQPPAPADQFGAVSIHASAGEATVMRIDSEKCRRVSIHASAGEATSPSISIS